MCLYTGGEGPDFTGGPLIREESPEVEASGDGRPDARVDQGLAAEETEKSTSTDQQTQKSEVCLIREIQLFRIIPLFDCGCFSLRPELCI